MPQGRMTRLCEARMVISFLEAADMSFRAVVSVAVTVGGMWVATGIMKTESAESRRLDISRPALWTAEPVRIVSASKVQARGDTETICTDSIGLRIDCALISASAL
jgi:hypothetical protein